MSTARGTGRGARIGIVKPDYGVTGGFETLLARLVDALVEAGHQIEPIAIPGRQLPRPVWGQSDAASRWFEHPDFFNYAAMAHDTRRLELDAFDLVISTQPPSYLAPHPHMLGLFYHQARIFYELSQPYIDAGFADPELHRAASTHVRTIDRTHLGGVVHWLAGSTECADRLTSAWEVDEPISLLDAPPLTDAPTDPPAWSAAGPVVCVSRQEWPKRTELVVAAGHITKHETLLLGGGGRHDHLIGLDRRMADGTLDPTAPLDSALARIERPPTARLRMPGRRTARPDESPVTLAGSVSDDERNQAYGAASVVIAPAFREDYGLTALEAMAWGRPVIVCRDGGGLVETVESTGAGLVVEPNARAIADGIRTIHDTPGLGAELSERARATRNTYTWERANGQLLSAVDAALAVAKA